MKTGAIGTSSPNTGSTIVVTPGSWALASKTDPNLPDWIKDEVAQREANKASNEVIKVYRSSVSATVSGGVGDGTMSNAESYSVWSCPTGSTSCGPTGSSFSGEKFSATQGGNSVDETTVAVGPNTQPVLIVGKSIDAGYISQSGNAYVGSYRGENTSFKILSFGSDGEPVTDSNGISGSNTYGAFFGGNATPTTDMTTLKNSNVTATYDGWFSGQAAQPGPLATLNGDNGPFTNVAEVNGNAGLVANFGTGKVYGNVYNMTDSSAQNAWFDANCASGCNSQNAPAPTAMPYGLVLDATIDGSKYSGSTKYTAAASAPGAAALTSSPTGQVLGGFFGTNASETAGVVRITGTAPGTGPGTGANTTLMGGFGAQKVGPVVP